MTESCLAQSLLNDYPAALEKTGHEDHGLKINCRCPKCFQAKLDSNGLLNLFCPKCGFEQGGTYA